MNRELFFDLALELDLKTVLNICRTSKKLNETICSNNYFWKRKLEKDYPNTRGKFSDNSNYKYIYENIKEITLYMNSKNVDSKNVNSKNIDSKNVDLKNVYLKNVLIEINDQNYTENKRILIEGKFPKGTVIWVASEDNTPFNNRGFLTKKEAIDYLIKILNVDIEKDYGKGKEDFIVMYGKTPEKYFGFSSPEEALFHYKKELENGNRIEYPSSEALEAGENDIYEIIEMTIS